MQQLQRSWVRSQHPSAQWNLRGGRWSSAEYCNEQKEKKSPQKYLKKKLCSCVVPPPFPLRSGDKVYLERCNMSVCAGCLRVRFLHYQQGNCAPAHRYPPPSSHALQRQGIPREESYILCIGYLIVRFLHYQQDNCAPIFCPFPSPMLSRE
jgi:hypothetical protein